MSVRYELRGSAAWLTLDRPEAMNALDSAIAAGLTDGLERARTDHAHSIVITGAGRAFCAGADLHHVLGHSDASGAIEAYVAELASAIRSVADYPGPTIAAVNGLAYAGGLELVLACDLVVAARSARLADAHATFGLFPGAGGAALLPRRIGTTRAKWLLFTGEPLSAEELVVAGLVNRVVEDDELEPTIDALCATLAQRSAAGLRRMKAVADVATDRPVAEALRLEFAAFREHVRSDDALEGLTAFTEKRRPRFAAPSAPSS